MSPALMQLNPGTSATVAAGWQQGVNLAFVAPGSVVPPPTPGRQADARPAQPQGTLLVDGVTVPRAPSQAAMAKTYTEQDVDRLGINSHNTRVYVIDDFNNASVRTGTGASAVDVPHGRVVEGILKATLKGRGAVIPLNVDGVGGPGIAGKTIAQAIHVAIEREAKRQNMTVDAVDLSHASINMSLGRPAQEGIEPAIAAAVEEWTRKGGTFFVSAGNDSYSAYATLLRDITIVDGSSERVGGKVSAQPLPSTWHNNASNIAGIDFTAARVRKAGSSTVIAPEVLLTRLGRDGSIEFKDVSSPTGWSRLIARELTVPAQAAAVPTDGLSGTRPKALVSVEQINGLQTWISAEVKKAMATSSQPNATTINHITDAEYARLYKAMQTETAARFGPQAMMTLAAYQGYVGTRPGNLAHQMLQATIPEGLTASDVLLSVDQVVLRMMSPLKGEAAYFVLDKQRGLQAIQPGTQMTTGTSWAAPFALGKTLLDRRAQVMEGQARRKD